MENVIIGVLSGAALGFSLAVPPGPMNALIANEALRSRLKGISMGLSAVSADAVLFAMVSLFFKQIPQEVIDLLFVVGACVMFFIAWKIRDARVKHTSTKSNYAMGLLMGLTNPFQIIWWATAGPFLISQLGVFAIAGLFTAVLAWATGFPLLINKTKNYISPAIIPKVSFAVLVFFGVLMLFNGITALVF